MRIAIIRHGEVDYNWSRWCTSDEFDKECTEYDRSPIKHISWRLPISGIQNVFISTLSRSGNTAKMLFATDNFKTISWIDEVPLRSSFDTEKKLPLWFWNISGRLQWFINCSRQMEGRLGTEKRARSFVDLLCKEGVDSAVVTHGFYMHVLLKEMRQAGFRIDNFHANYKNAECVIAER